MKTLVLTEKPSVGREYARVLKCRNVERGYCEGPDYIISWALGHLVTLADPHVYDNKYKEWRLEDLPMLPENMQLKVINKTSHQFRTISKLMKRKDVNKLIVATDAGREGELVARWIMKLGGWGKRSFRRLWISSQTDSAIRTGFSNLKPGNAYNLLFASAVCRSEADWLIGLNVTRALTCKYDISLNAGRVQTPILSIVVDREKAIREFKPVNYWNVITHFSDYYGIWRGNNGSASIFDYTTAEQIKEKVSGKQGTILNIAKKIKSEPPPFAYDLAEIQRDANNKFGYSAKKTLSILQSLYERHKLITYPRTDSRFITSDMVETLPDRLKSIAAGRYKNLVSPLLNKRLLPGKRFVYNVKVTDHHAIIPTEQVPVMNRLSADEKYIYDLVVRRFLAVLYPDYIYEQTAVVTIVEGEKFYSQGIVEKSRGWKSVGLNRKDTVGQKDNHLPEQIIRNLYKGNTRMVTTVRIPKLQTKPPERFTDATLLTAMENPGKYIDEDTAKNAIKCGSLGTPATRADIIEKLISNLYIYRKGKKITPSSKAFQLIELAPSELKTPELTAEWEMRLSKIEKGEENPETFLKDIRDNTEKLVQYIRKNDAAYTFHDSSEKKCPVCGIGMVLINDNNKKKFACADKRCGYEEFEKKDMLGFRKQTQKERQINKNLMRKYNDTTKATTNLGNLLKAALNGKEKNNVASQNGIIPD